MERIAGAAENGRGWLWAAASLLPVALVQGAVFFSDLDHFFQGDTVYWLYHRHRTWSSFLHAFVSTDNSGWYRPLTNRVLESLIYPFSGLNPVPYHLALFPILLLNTLAVYELSWMLTRRRFAAFLAAIFFGTHLVTANVTYDVSFTPELLYTLFYTSSAIGYLKYLRAKRLVALAISVLSCLAALCSKEPAVMLPFMLVAVHLIETADWRSLRLLKWHFLLLLIYGVFVVGYLRVGGIGSNSFFSRDKEMAAGYQVVFDRRVFANSSRALSGVFMLSAGEWPNVSSRLKLSVTIFRFTAWALLLLSMLSRERRIILLGVLWFFVSLVPVLTLGNHFMLYYLFLPIAGLALALGLAFNLGFEQVTRWSRVLRPVALSAIAILFGAVTVTSAMAITSERANSQLLGGSARAARDAVAAVRARHPRLAAGTTLLFLNRAAPILPWNDGQGGLFRMAFNEEKLTVLHASAGEFLDYNQIEDTQSFVIRYNGEVFQEIAGEERLKEGFLIEDPSLHEVFIAPTKVTAGSGSYTLRVPGFPEAEVKIFYRLDEGPVQSFMAKLKNDGGMSFDVGADTRKGTYRFVAVKPNESKLILTDKKLIVD